MPKQDAGSEDKKGKKPRTGTGRGNATGPAKEEKQQRTKRSIDEGKGGSKPIENEQQEGAKPHEQTRAVTEEKTLTAQEDDAARMQPVERLQETEGKGNGR